MRPGYLGSLDGFWFGNLDGKYFEILEPRSASPVYTIRDRMGGKTGEEFKALDYMPGWSTTNIVQAPISDAYARNPYKVNVGSWKQLMNHFRKKTQAFELIGR